MKSEVRTVFYIDCPSITASSTLLNPVVCQVLREEGKDAESTSYMWLYPSGSDGLSPIVLYDYQPGRGDRYPQESLEGFSGMLQCDGYQAYIITDLRHAVPDATVR